MQANLTVKCEQCKANLGIVKMDTADLPEELQTKINKVILRHRKDCRYYGGN
jgi:hypothetical protein